MMMEVLIDSYGTAIVLTLAGVLTGLIFGMSAQYSRFCLRAAVADVMARQWGTRFGIWLIVFSVALLSAQAMIYFDYLDVTEARQLAATGSLSGAIIGGLLFGAGMVLARGCASRLLVLSGTGNLRALLTGLLLTLVAQASLKGALAPAREYLSSLWTLSGSDGRSLLQWVGFGATPFVIMALGLLAFALLQAHQQGTAWHRSLAAIMVGLAVTLGWVLTYHISQNSFDVVALSSVTFTGPATDTLMLLVNERSFPLKFGVGLVVGVFIGSAFAAALAGEFKIQRFGPEVPMERYMAGAVLMGFGAMLAGGCAVGAGVTGTAIFAVTAWVAIFAMWMGAMATEAILMIWQISL